MSRWEGGIGTRRSGRDEARGRPATYPAPDRAKALRRDIADLALDQAGFEACGPGSDQASRQGWPLARLHPTPEVHIDERADPGPSAGGRPALRHPRPDRLGGCRCRWEERPRCSDTGGGSCGSSRIDLVEGVQVDAREVALADLVLARGRRLRHRPSEQVRCRRGVLGEIGAGDLPEVLALNKWDRLDEMRARA